MSQLHGVAGDATALLAARVWTLSAAGKLNRLYRVSIDAGKIQIVEAHSVEANEHENK